MQQRRRGKFLAGAGRFVIGAGRLGRRKTSTLSRMRRLLAKTRQTLTVAFATGLACACTVQFDGSKGASESARTVAGEESAGPAVETDAKEIGVFDLANGVFTFGTGQGTASIAVDSKMVPFERAYVETGVLGVEDADGKGASISISPRSALHPGVSSKELAEMLTNENDMPATPVEEVTHIGQVEAVAADTVTKRGQRSRVYLVTINNVAWNITVKAPTEDRLRELIGMLGSFQIKSAEPPNIGAIE